MNRTIGTIVVTSVMILMSACATAPVGLNVQRSSARATGDVATTLVLEANYDKVTPAQVVEVATTIKDTIGSVDLSTIRRDDLVALIESRIKVDFLKNWAQKVVNVVPEETDLSAAKVVMVDMLDQAILAAGKFDPAAIRKQEQ